MDRRYELHLQIQSSKGMAVLNRKYTHGYSYHIFRGNLDELIKGLKIIENPDVGIKLVSTAHKIEGITAHREINRLLHNFLASAKTLVDHTRNYIDREYGGTELAANYRDRVSRDITSDGLHAFISDLRNYVIHKGVPSNQMTVTILAEGPTITSALLMKKSQLGEWDKWSAGSKNFLANQKEEIVVSHMVEEYGKKIIKLYEWLDIAINKYHARELDELHAFQAELKALGPE